MALFAFFIYAFDHTVRGVIDVLPDHCHTGVARLMLHRFYLVSAFVIFKLVPGIIAIVNNLLYLLVEFIVPVFIAFIVAVAGFLIYKIAQAVVLINRKTIVVPEFFGSGQAV